MMRSSRSFLKMGTGPCNFLFCLGAWGCGSDESDPVATAGTGGAPVGAAGTSSGGTAGGGTAGSATAGGGAAGSGAAGTAGSGGSTAGAGGAPAAIVPLPIPCPPLQAALLTNFEGAPVAGADAGAGDAGAVPGSLTFGDFSTTFSGGVFTYPNAAGDPFAVSSDASTGEWHMSGNIGTYSGFGLFFNACNVLDASDYAGISFTIRGNVAMTNSVSLNVAVSENDISYAWLSANGIAEPPNSGRCTPAATQYDGTCAAPAFTVPVTETETTISVRWDEFSAGLPRADVNPQEITAIRWIFPNPAGAGTATPTPYAVDLYIDDLTFITP